MNMLSPRLFFFTLLLSLSYTSVSASALKMNGIAEYNELGSAVYIGALFVESPSDSAESILNSQGSKTMQIHFSLDRYSVRSFTQHITEWADLNPTTVANESLDAFKDLRKAVRDMIGRRNFIKGDVLAITLLDSGKTEFRLNGQVLQSIDDKQLFAYILSAWISKPHADEDFRANMLSIDTNDSLTQGMVNTYYALSGNEDYVLKDEATLNAIQTAASNSSAADIVASSTVRTSGDSNQAEDLETLAEQQEYYNKVKRLYTLALQKELNGSSIPNLKAVLIYFDEKGKVIKATPVLGASASSNDIESGHEDAIQNAAENVSPIPVSPSISHPGIFSLSVEVN